LLPGGGDPSFEDRARHHPLSAKNEGARRAIPSLRCAKLTAFVISGVLAGIAGALFTHLNQSFSVTSYNTAESFNVFTSAVIGGLGSLGGGILGAVYLRGIRWFITSPEWQLLSSGAGVLLVLLILPGGLGALWVTVRDVMVRLLVRRRPQPAVEVPSAVPVEPAA
jgi:nitrate/nitrite transporter NarK